MWAIPLGLILCVVSNFLISAINFSSIYDKYLFYPSHNVGAPAELKGADCQVRSFKSEGQEIVCWYYKRANDDGLVLISHGNGGNLSHGSRLAAHMLKDTNCSVLLYDYAGYGKSEGKPSVKGILQDGLAAFDFAVDSLGYNANQIIVYGESLGCAVTCHIASERKPGGIILQSGFRSLPTIARDTFAPLKVMPGFAFPEPKLDNEKVLRGVHAPLLILHGKHDRIVPFHHGEELYRTASQPKIFVPLEHSGHNDTCTADGDLYDKAVSDFVKSLGKQSASASLDTPPLSN